MAWTRSGSRRRRRGGGRGCYGRWRGGRRGTLRGSRVLDGLPGVVAPAWRARSVCRSRSRTSVAPGTSASRYPTWVWRIEQRLRWKRTSGIEGAAPAPASVDASRLVLHRGAVGFTAEAALDRDGPHRAALPVVQAADLQGMRGRDHRAPSPPTGRGFPVGNQSAARPTAGHAPWTRPQHVIGASVVSFIK